MALLRNLGACGSGTTVAQSASFYAAQRRRTVRKGLTRMTKTRFGMALAACALLAACSSSPPPAPAAAPEAPPPPPPPPAPVASFDGTYAGTVVRVRTPNPHACVPSHHETVHVANGVFTYVAGRHVLIHATVQPGGDFSGTTGDTTIKGQIADGKVTGTSDGTNCGYTI